jgi:electron transfer flavoprotein alpha subunit
MDKAAVWTIAEIEEGCALPVSFEMLARGRDLADKLRVPLVSLAMGCKMEEEELRRLIFGGADTVAAIDDEKLDGFQAETYSNTLTALARRYEPQIILAGATVNGRTLLPHAAMRLRAGLTADCTGLDIEEETGNLLQTRPAIGGNILATIKTPDARPQMATVRPRSTLPLPENRSRSGEIERIPFEEQWHDRRVKRLGLKKNEAEQVNIQASEIVISGGRGMKKRDNFALLEELTEHLGGVLGASREAVDRGWIAYPHQVGLSGKTVVPSLYIAAGISGAIQHLAGMKTADHIIAINDDPNAPILQVADFAVVGDLFQVLPHLNRRLKEEYGR